MDRTPDSSESGGKRQDIVREIWRKLVECEERLAFWRKMVALGIGVRELEYIGEDIRDKYRSESMKSGKSHREVIEFVMSLKLSSGLWTKNTAFWARDWGQKKGAVRLRPWKS